MPEEVRELFAGVRERGIAAEAEWDEGFEAYAAEHSDLADEYLRITSRGVPQLPPISAAPKFEPGDDPIATRSASGKALNWLAPKVPELLGGSADLAPSTSTNLDDYASVLRHDFGGRNLHFGIREHAMGAIVNAMTIEGLRAYGATFLVFSDYMRGAIRLAALMEIPSIFVYTHDSIGVGEDGPTHQPIEQLAALRAMPNLDVIRPADVNETLLAWHWLLGGNRNPTALVLSRQKLPVLDRDAIPDDAVERGAYVLRDAEAGGDPDVILIGTGSEVSLCLEAADLLAAEGTSVRVVSMPSTTRFAEQDAGLPRRGAATRRHGPRLGRGGSHVRLGSLGRRRGLRVGIDHFGASAPAADVVQGLPPDRRRRRRAGPRPDRRRVDEVRLRLRPRRRTRCKGIVLDTLKADGHVPIDLGADDARAGRRLPGLRARGRPGDARRRRRAGHPRLRLRRRRRGRGLEGRGDPRGDGARHLHGRTSASSTTTATCSPSARG